MIVPDARRPAKTLKTLVELEPKSLSDVWTILRDLEKNLSKIRLRLRG